MQVREYTAPTGAVNTSAPRSEHLDELTRRAQWVNHRAKRPIDPNTGQAASSTDPATWSTYNAALARVTAGDADGIGFVITNADPYTVIDLDDCRDPHTGAVNPDALAIVEEIESYTEISPSGTGIHIWLRASIPGTRNRTGKVEIYQTGRYMTVTGRPLPGYSQPIRESQAQLNALYARLFPQAVNTTPAAPVVLTLEDADIIERIRGEYSGKGAALLRGDAGDYGGDYSRGREALAWKACFYTDDASQVARILRSSGMWRDKHDDKERDRRSMIDATKAVATYTGARYDPTYADTGTRLIMPAAAPIEEPEPEEDPRTIDQLRAELVAVKAELRQYRQVTGAITEILACDQIEAGPRLTAIGVLFVGLEMKAKGRKQTPQGYHIPAEFVARKTGQTHKTVSSHLRKLQGDKDKNIEPVIDRTVKREDIRVMDEFVDTDGVIEREPRKFQGKRNYIAFPDNVLDFSARFTTYRRPEDAPKHGGERPTCEHHPEAGTYTEHITRCRQCHKVLDERTTKTSGPLLGTVTSMNGSIPKMGIETDVSIARPKMGIDSEPPASQSVPMMGVDWQDERRKSYGAVYRGEGQTA